MTGNDRRWRAAVATAGLLRTVLAHDHVDVVELGRQKEELENVFMELMREDANDVR